MNLKKNWLHTKGDYMEVLGITATNKAHNGHNQDELWTELFFCELKVMVNRFEMSPQVFVKQMKGKGLILCFDGIPQRYSSSPEFSNREVFFIESFFVLQNYFYFSKSSETGLC